MTDVETGGKSAQRWDVIALTGLAAVGSHGVYDFERVDGQMFVADVHLHVDTRQAATTDDVVNTIDYSKIADEVVAIITGPPVALIETLASRLAKAALAHDGVRKVEVTVHKPQAPLPHQFEDVSVTVVREQRGEVLPEPQSASKVSEQGRPAVLTPLPAPKPPPASEPVPVTPKVVTPPRPRTLPSRVPGRHSRDEAGPQYRENPSRRKPHVYDVVLALGANKGEVVETLRGAVEALANLDGFQVEAVSPLVLTRPVLEPGALPQDDYLNAVVLGKTVLAPPALLAATQEIENEFGRVRTTHWGSRTLDIDIITLDRMRLNTKTLTLPHPRAHERAFVLYPWITVDPEAAIPVHGRAKELLPTTPDLGGVLTEYPDWLEAEGSDTGPATSLHLAPRPPEQPRPVVQTGAPEVTLRGETVALAGVEKDPIFRSLLAREEQEARRVPRVHAQARPEAHVAPPPRRRPATTGIPVRTHPTPSPDTEPESTPPAQSMPDLPDWDFRRHQANVTVVDSFEAEAAPESQTRPIPRLARGITVRPTPTGSVPLPPRGTRGRRPTNER